MKKALILLGHGSRHADADSTLRAVAHGVQSAGGFDIVALAFLQHTKPGPEEVLEDCVRQGAATVTIVPLFLQPGAHVAKDVPALVQAARTRFPGVTIRVTELVGSHPLMIQIVLDLAKSASSSNS